MKAVNIDLQVGKSGQKSFYLETFSVGSTKLWIKIQPDSVECQSRAEIFAWSGSAGEWKLVHSLKPEEMKTDKTMVYRTLAPRAVDFKIDRNRLLDAAGKILGLEEK
jgi:hypothetical protein